MTGRRAGRFGVRVLVRARDLSPKRAYRLLGLPILLLSGYGKHEADQSHLVLRLRMSGCIPPLSLYPVMKCTCIRMLTYFSRLMYIKHKDQNIQNCSFCCCFVRVWNLVGQIKGKIIGWGCSRRGCWWCFGLRGRKWTETGEHYISKSFMTSTAYPMWLGWWNQDGYDGRGMWHVWRVREIHTWFWCREL